MIDYTCPICKDCDRYPNACDHPCQKYSDYQLNYYLTQQAENVKRTIERLDGKGVKTDNISDNCNTYDDTDTNIESILDYSVEDIIWVRVLNQQIPYTELINKNAFYDYLNEQNIKYCEDNCLCSVCRTPLVEKVEMEEIWGSMQESERYWHCPYGCI